MEAENFFEREKRDADKREENAERTMRFLSLASKIEPLHGKKVEEIFSNEENKREFIDGLQPDEFIELLSGVNGILRGKEQEEWKMDGEHVQISSLIETIMPPNFKDKPELFMETLSAAKEMNNQGRSLEDIAILFSSLINAVHGFNDGNGRTSRLVYSLFTKNFEGRDKEEIKKTLLEDGRMEININPGLIDFRLERMLREQADSDYERSGNDRIARIFWQEYPFEYKEDIDQENIGKLGHLLQNDRFMLIVAMYDYFSNHSEIDINQYEERRGDNAILRWDWLAKDLRNEDIEEIINDYRQVKKELVRGLIDCIENPDKEEYEITGDEGRIQLFDYYKKEIQKEREGNQEILKKEDKKESQNEKFDFGT